MSRKKKMTAWFLVLTMVCSMFVGVPVSAEETELTGFVVSTDFIREWNQEEECDYIIEVNNMNRDDKWGENADSVMLAFGYINPASSDPNYLSWEDICVEYWDEEAGDYVDIKESIGYSEVGNVAEGIIAYELSFPDADTSGDTYRFYQTGNEDEAVSFHYDVKRFGFYKESTIENNGNGTDYLNTFYYGSDDTFYLLPYDNDDRLTLDADTTAFDTSAFDIEVWDGEGNWVEDPIVENYLTMTEIEGSEFGGYEVQVKESAIEENVSMNLRFCGKEQWYDENENPTNTYTREETIFITSTPDNDFVMVHDENCDLSSDMCPVVYDKDGKAVGETRYVVDCAIDNHGNRYVSKYYTAEEISVYKAEWQWSEENGDYPVRGEKISNVIQDVTDENGNNSIYFTFEENGDYYLVLEEEDNVERLIFVHPAGWAEFYETKELGDVIWNHTTMGTEEDSTFYFAARDLGEYYFVDNVEFSVYVNNKKVQDISSYVECNEVVDPNDNTIQLYEIKIKGTSDFELVAESDWRDPDYSWTQKNFIGIEYVDTGLVLVDAEWQYNDELDRNELTGSYFADSSSKNKTGEIGNVWWFGLGTYDGEEYVPIVDAFTNAENKASINGTTEYEIVASDNGNFAQDKDTVIVDPTLAENGIYGFYIRDNIEITYGEDEKVTIAKQLPAIGFYKGNEASFDNYIRDDYFMSETEMFEGMDIYVLPREDVENYSYTLDTLDKTILVNDKPFVYQHISEDYPAGFYRSSSEFNSPIKISVEKCAGSFLRVIGDIEWQEHIDPFEQYLSLLYQNEDAVILEDNSPHEGFAGCLISESDYKVSQWWQMSGDVYYWVHGETIQDVVDQLSAVAEAGKVTVDGKTYPIGMTDYIWLNTSYFEYSKKFANSTQHVVTPSNIKGIIMQADAEAPYAMYDDRTTKGYYQVQEWTDGANTLLLTQVMGGDKLYPVVKLSEEDAIVQRADYKVVDYENYFTATGEGVDQRLVQDGYTAYGPVLDEYGDPTNAYPVYLPNLYVDATVEVKMIGNFGAASENKKVQLGFYKGSTNKSIINGQEFSADNIGDEPVVVGNEENQVTVSVTEFKASTECSKAPINGESCNVTLGGENASLRDKIDIYQKGDDDYADAKALAEGKPLKVKLDVKESKADDAEAKKVAEQVEKDCAKDKKKPSKVQYLDIDMKYQVGDRSPKAVTETLEEVDITMDLPDSFQQTGKHTKKRKYKVYRYHDGKVDMLDAEFDKDKKKLHFKTDKFSTYALVAEDVVATGIEITSNPAKLAYVEGEMFDGTGMTVSVIYSDGTKEAVTDFAVSATNALALTDTAVTITYEGYTVQIPITVTAKAIAPEIGTTEATTNGTCEVTGVAADGTVEVTFTPSKANKKAKKAKIDKTVTIDGKEYAVTAVGDNAFSGNTKMTSISIPDTVTKIGNNAFKGCTKLKKVTVPKNVTEIGNNAFYNCKKVSKLTIKGSSLEKIGNAAFRKCSNLKSVTIPKNVTEIGKDSFRDCKKLNKVTIKGNNITKIGKNAFKNVSKKATIKVPKKKKAAYKKLFKKAGYKQTVK